MHFNRTREQPKYKLLYFIVNSGPSFFITEYIYIYIWFHDICPQRHFPANNIRVEIFQFWKNNVLLKRIAIKKIINIYLMGKKLII